MIAAARRRSSGTCVIADARVVAGAGGGPDKTILHSPRFLLGTRYHMLCVYLRSPTDAGFAALRQRAQALSAPLREIDDRGPLDWRVLPELLRLCRREGVRIWHGHDYKTNLLGLALGRFLPVRLVTTVHGWVQNSRRTPLYYALDRLSLRHYEKVLCVSPDLVARCRAAGVPAGRLVLLENGIDTEMFRRCTAPAEARRQLGLDPRIPLIGAVGRLSPEKGFDLLIRAFARVQAQAQVGPMKLVILGEGPERERLAALADECGAAGNVMLPGFQGDVRPWYEAMDGFVLSSLREGLPNVVLEAMAMHVPVAATSVAGVPRLVQHEATGLLLPPGSVGALTEAMQRLLTDHPAAEGWAAAARRLVEQCFSFACRMKQLREVYDELMGH